MHANRGELHHYIPDMTPAKPTAPLVRGFEPEELKRAGRRVIDWRRAHKKTQREFAKLAGVSIGAVQSLEAGTRQTRPTSIAKIAKAIALTPDQLFERDPNQPVAAVLNGSYARGTAIDLLPDTIDVAWLYQCADGDLKAAIKDALCDYYRTQERRTVNGASPSGPEPFIVRVKRTIANAQRAVEHSDALIRDRRKHGA